MLPFVWLCCSMIVPPAFVCSCWTFVAGCFDVDLFFFTSVSEDTSTVVLEAISSQLPILCFDTCGFGYVINEKVGIKIPLTNPKQSVKA